jgi:hypothetical protein
LTRRSTSACGLSCARYGTGTARFMILLSRTLRRSRNRDRPTPTHSTRTSILPVLIPCHPSLKSCTNGRAEGVCSRSNHFYKWNSRLKFYTEKIWNLMWPQTYIHINIVCVTKNLQVWFHFIIYKREGTFF